MKKKATKPRKARESSPAKKKDPIFKHAKSVIFRTGEQGEIVIMDLSNGRHFFKVDGLAAEFWKKLDGKKRISALVDQLQKKSKLDKKLVTTEALKLVKALQAAKLVEPV